MVHINSTPALVRLCKQKPQVELTGWGVRDGGLERRGRKGRSGAQLTLCCFEAWAHSASPCPTLGQPCHSSAASRGFVQKDPVTLACLACLGWDKHLAR
jgi:hypothetical protein